jgi:hypothetical protein
MSPSNRLGRARLGVLPALLIALACGGGSTGLDGPIRGEWGGEGVSLVIAQSEGSVEFDCAHGRFGPLLLEEGRFTAAGTWTREGGPVFGDGPPPLAAVYEGVSFGRRLVFTVHVQGETRAFGPFTVLRGEEPLLRKCL